MKEDFIKLVFSQEKNPGKFPTSAFSRVKHLLLLKGK